MRVNSIIISLFLTGTLLSCKEPMVTFNVPQPENEKELKKIPQKLIGRYFSADNAELMIYSSYIVEKIRVEDTLEISELSKSELIVRDTLYNRNTGEKYKIKVIMIRYLPITFSQTQFLI